jgi:maleamate amidohydrolase
MTCNGLGKRGEKRAEENTIVEQIAPITGGIVIEKRRPSGFFGTNLIDMLIYHRLTPY